MDGLSSAASVIAALQAVQTSKFIYPTWEILTLHRLRENYSDLKRKFGTLQALVLITIFPDAKAIVDRVERHVLGARTEEAMVLRKSTSEDCTMLAVAAAIVAQVAITALALEDIDKVHWTAAAAFVLSLTAGGLSVFYACLVQQRMSSLFTTDDVKDFFSKPSSSEDLALFEQYLDALVKRIRRKCSHDDAPFRPQRMAELEGMIREFKGKNRWKSASFHSILMVKAPTLLLKYAVASFVVGLGVYFGCLAFSEVGSASPRASHRAIFIVYVVTSFLGLLIYYVPSTLKKLEWSPARRYLQIMTNELAKRPDREEPHQEGMEIFQNIKAVLNSDEQDTNVERRSDDAVSWKGRGEDINRPQHGPAHVSDRRSNRAFRKFLEGRGCC